MNWYEVWNNRKLPTEYTLQALLTLDGFDVGAGKVRADEWLNYALEIKAEMGMQYKDNVYEVGCGAGAFLYALKQKSISGCDYSEKQIKSISKIFPYSSFDLCRADEISTDDKYDFVISNSVFQYLDLETAEKVITLMIKKARKAVGIFDIPDDKLRVMTEVLRSKTTENYNERYKDLEHTYYDREFFDTYNPKYVKGTPTLEGENRFGVVIWTD